METAEKGNTFVNFIIIVLIIWGVSALFSDDEPEVNTYQQNTYYDSYPAQSSYGGINDVGESDYYEEPENPYDEGSGHSAGYEWAEENGVDSCGGNSNSFIEGCEEYLSQQEEYEN